MQITVLGTNGPYPGPGRACSGYLVTCGDTNILLDCGSGVFSRLQCHLDIGSLSAIVLSHLHYDHISDLYVVRYGLEAAISRGERTEPLPLFALPQPAEVFSSLAHKDLFQLNPLAGWERLTIGELELSFQETLHALPCLAVSVSGAGKCLVYSGDTEYFPELIPFIAGADLFLCEAPFLQADIEAGKPNHLSGRQAAALAKEAGVGNLLLTHLAPWLDEEVLLAEAKEVFPATHIAREYGTYSL